MSWSNSAAIGALVAVLGFSGSAGASGGVREVKLAQAVGQAGMILVVKKATPATETKTVHLPYVKGGKRLTAPTPTVFQRFVIVRVLKRSSALATTTAESLLRPGKRFTSATAAIKAGAVVRVVSSTTITSQSVRARYLADGTRKIPIYRRLAGRVDHQGLKKARRFVLLASFASRYEALRGFGGWGLLPAKAARKIKRLLRKR